MHCSFGYTLLTNEGLSAIKTVGMDPYLGVTPRGELWQAFPFLRSGGGKMYMGGIAGKVIYSGDVQPFLPLIRMAEKVHLGKNTQFGLGMIRKT